MNSHAGCAVAFVVGREGRTLRMLSHVIRLCSRFYTWRRSLLCRVVLVVTVVVARWFYVFLQATSASYLLACPHVVRVVTLNPLFSSED